MTFTVRIPWTHLFHSGFASSLAIGSSPCLLFEQGIRYHTKGAVIDLCCQQNPSSGSNTTASHADIEPFIWILYPHPNLTRRKDLLGTFPEGPDIAQASCFQPRALSCASLHMVFCFFATSTSQITTCSLCSAAFPSNRFPSSVFKGCQSRTYALK
jgi:hypothetical protein